MCYYFINTYQVPGMIYRINRFYVVLYFEVYLRRCVVALYIHIYQARQIPTAAMEPASNLSVVVPTAPLLALGSRDDDAVRHRVVHERGLPGAGLVCCGVVRYL